jgi:hypothetical protein
MRQFFVVRNLAAVLTVICLSFFAGCGGSSATKNPIPAKIVLSPATLSLNEGDVTTISAIAQDSNGNGIAADITFSSSSPSIASISTGGSICGGVWDSSFIVCTPTIGQAGVGQVTITASSGGVNATMTVYVHLKVDLVVVTPPTGCVTMGQTVTTTASAFSTSAPGCSPASPCDITSTVGPITINSNDLTVVAYSSGIEPTFSPVTNSPTYTSGGSITGSTGQTCNLSNFASGNASGIDPTFSLATNSPTYTSGGTIAGNTGQTCTLTNFNGVTGATASVALTGSNTIASGTHLTITSEGSGGISPPTTATLSNGTATCSGTANVITALINNTGLGFSVVGATATVTLTKSNTIAAGTHLNVTASGFGATTPPTTATLSNGTATCSGVANVITALTANGTFTAQNPGSTTVFGSVSGLNSVAVPYLTCPVATIMVHDANSSNTSFTLTPNGTQMLTADVFDTNGQYIKPSITWGSSAIASVTVAKGSIGDNPATMTGVAPGTAYITATCSDPDCNKNIGAQYSLNVVTAAVPGGTTTTVYAASSNSLSLVPINTSTNTAGTPITLPFPPTSIVADPAGKTLYLGSASSGLMAVNVSTGVVTTYSVFGTIEAISPDGNFLLLSYPPNNSLYYFSVSTLSTVFTRTGDTTNSSAFTPDSKLSEWLNGDKLGVVIPAVPFFNPTMLGYTGTALDISGQGGLTYITAATPNGIDVRSTCDQSEVLALSANSPTLIKAIPNGTGAVALDSPAIDVVTTGAVQAGCPAAAMNSVTSFDLGAGPFNARQIFLNSSGSAVWIVSDLPELLLFDLIHSIPYSIPYVAGATAYNGGTTLDSTQVYVGASDGTVHRIDVASHTDAQQIAVGLKDSNGNPVTPNLVYVVP